MHGLVVPMAAAPHGEYDAETSAAGPGTLWALLTPLLALLDRVGLVTATPEDLQKRGGPPGPHRGTLRAGHRHVQQPGQDARRRTRRQPAARCGRRAKPRVRSVAASPPYCPNWRAAPPWPRNSPRHCSSHGTLLAGTSRRARTPTTSSATGSRRARHSAPGSSCSGTADGRPQRLPGRPGTGTRPRHTVSELEPEEGGELEAVAELLAITDFAAVYLSLASAPQP